MIWSPFVLVAAAAAATPKKRTATPGLVLASFGDGPKYEGTLAYFRARAAHLGFSKTVPRTLRKKRTTQTQDRECL